jgi:hypothetical protein
MFLWASHNKLSIFDTEIPISQRDITMRYRWRWLIAFDSRSSVEAARDCPTNELSTVKSTVSKGIP